MAVLGAHEAIRQAQAAWKEQGRQEDLLLSPGFQLERARTLIADGGDIPIEHVRDFVDLSSEREWAGLDRRTR